MPSSLMGKTPAEVEDIVRLFAAEMQALGVKNEQLWGQTKKTIKDYLLTEARRETEHLEASKAAIQSDIDILDFDMLSLQSEFEKLQRTYVELDDQLVETEPREDLEQIYLLIKEATTDEPHLLERLAHDSKTLEDIVDRWNEEMSGVRASIYSLGGDIRSIGAKAIAAAKEKIEGYVEEKYAALESTLEENRAFQNQRLEEKSREILVQANAMTQQSHTVLKELDGLRRAFGDELTKLRTEQQFLLHDLQTVTQDRNKLLDDKNNLLSLEKTHEERVASLELDLGEAKNTVVELQSNLRQMHQQQEEASAAMENLKGEKARLSNDIITLDADITRLNTAFIQADGAHADEVNGLKSQLERMEAKLKISDGNHHAALEDLSAMNSLVEDRLSLDSQMAAFEQIKNVVEKEQLDLQNA